jgi:hypothetical protein
LRGDREKSLAALFAAPKVVRGVAEFDTFERQSDADPP